MGVSPVGGCSTRTKEAENTFPGKAEIWAPFYAALLSLTLKCFGKERAEDLSGC